jgi:hypothetical protein
MLKEGGKNGINVLKEKRKNRRGGEKENGEV